MITTIILAKNTADKIEGAIQSIRGLSDEIIVLEGGSTDDTVRISKSAGAKVLKQVPGGYSDWRNQGIEVSRGDWIFYLDFDERVTPELRDEILQVVKSDQHAAYAAPRVNIILGKKMLHGGWWPDYVERLFKKNKELGWYGDLHERPTYKGALGYLKNPLIHLKHDNLSEMIEKTNQWSEVEAKLLLDARHPKMSWWRFIRIMLTELWDRLIAKRGFMDGTEGIIYALYQMWSKFVTYGKLWEMQRK